MLNNINNNGNVKSMVKSSHLIEEMLFNVTLKSI